MNGKLADGTRVRDRKSGDLGTVISIINGPDALDMDDTIQIVEWDSDDVIDGTVRELRDHIEVVEASP